MIKVNRDLSWIGKRSLELYVVIMIILALVILVAPQYLLLIKVMGLVASIIGVFAAVIAASFIFQKIITSVSYKSTKNTKENEDYQKPCNAIRRCRDTIRIKDELQPPNGIKNKTDDTKNNTDNTNKLFHAPTLSQGKE